MVSGGGALYDFLLIPHLFIGSAGARGFSACLFSDILDSLYDSMNAKWGT